MFKDYPAAKNQVCVYELFSDNQHLQVRPLLLNAFGRHHHPCQFQVFTDLSSLPMTCCQKYIYLLLSQKKHTVDVRQCVTILQIAIRENRNNSN
jgi:hypothetical protein